MSDSAPTSTDLALERTRMAHERTLMAWIRTATSLISFGFSIYKFFQYMQQQGEARDRAILGPRQFALLMIAIGLCALILATIQHRLELQKLRKHFAVPYSLATLIAGLIGLLGLLSFLAVIFRQ